MHKSRIHEPPSGKVLEGEGWNLSGVKCLSSDSKLKKVCFTLTCIFS